MIKIISKTSYIYYDPNYPRVRYYFNNAEQPPFVYN